MDRRDRIEKGMLMQGGACPGVWTDATLSFVQLADEREELEQRLQAVRDRIERIKKGDYS